MTDDKLGDKVKLDIPPFINEYYENLYYCTNDEGMKYIIKEILKDYAKEYR